MENQIVNIITHLYNLYKNYYCTAKLKKYITKYIFFRKNNYKLTIKL